MKARGKLFLMIAAVACLGYAAHQTALHILPRPPTPQQMGLQWLRQEYRLSDEVFQKIAQLHEAYFIRCDEMCATMERAHRPLLIRGHSDRDQQLRAAALRKEKAICENCLSSMVNHLHSVAALMPPEEGARFLRDILPEVINPPELQKLRSQVTPLQ